MEARSFARLSQLIIVFVALRLFLQQTDTNSHAAALSHFVNHLRFLCGRYL